MSLVEPRGEQLSLAVVHVGAQIQLERQALPIDFEPRFLRERVIDSIGRGAFDEARYWNDRHVAEFAEDAQGLRGLDVIEGTAQYVETVGVIVARLGCDATDAEIAAEMAANIDSFVFDVGYDAGGESYVLGPLAGVALRARDGQGFEEQAKSAPLHEILLESVTAAAVEGVGSAYRMGGDEFCALVPADGADVDEIAARFTKALREDHPDVPITCSAGAARIPEDATDVRMALLVADGRMYADKASRKAGRRAGDVTPLPLVLTVPGPPGHPAA